MLCWLFFLGGVGLLIQMLPDIILGYNKCGPLYYGFFKQDESTGETIFLAQIIDSASLYKLRTVMVGNGKDVKIDFATWSFEKMIAFCIALGGDYLQGGIMTIR